MNSSLSTDLPWLLFGRSDLQKDQPSRSRPVSRGRCSAHQSATQLKYNRAIEPCQTICGSAFTANASVASAHCKLLSLRIPISSRVADHESSRDEPSNNQEGTLFNNPNSSAVEKA